MDAKDDWQSHAAMLNLSVRGVACRVRKPRRDRQGAFIRIGQTLAVNFRIPVEPGSQPGCDAEPFRLHGRVVSITPGHAPDHVVVGIEFLDDGDLAATKSRLQTVLERVPPPCS